jgi:hypothetical protein
MDPSAIQGAITGTVLNAVSVDGRIATSDPRYSAARIRRSRPGAVRGRLTSVRYRSLSSAVAPSSPLVPGLLESGLLQDVLDLPPGEASASHLSDALAVAPVGGTLHFNGYLVVPSDGGYTLSVLASGHTTLAIDGRVLASSPKERALVCGALGYATQAAVGGRVLRKGLHRFELSAERAPGVSTLALKWDGPGMLRSDVPDAAFKHTPTPAQP